MSDQTPNGTVTPQAGQPAPAAQSQEYLTRKDLEAAIDTLGNRFYGALQSELAKLGKGQPAPVAPNPGTVAPASPAQPAPAAQTPAPAAQPARFLDVNQWVESLEKASGLQIMDNDPEAEELKAILAKGPGEENARQWAEAYERNLAAKRQRLNPVTQTPTNASGGGMPPHRESVEDKLAKIAEMMKNPHMTKAQQAELDKLMAETKGLLPRQ